MNFHNVWSLFIYVYQFTCCGYLFSFSFYVSSTLKWCQHIQLEFGGTTWKWGYWYKCRVHCRWCSKFQTCYLCDDCKYYVATLSLGLWLHVECKGSCAQKSVFGCPLQDECSPIFTFLKIYDYKPNMTKMMTYSPSLQRMEQHKYWKSSDTHSHKWGRMQGMEPNDSQMHSHLGQIDWK